MIPVKQDRIYSETTKGNCMQAAVASLLELTLEDVPNFVEDKYPWASFATFMERKGLYALRLTGKYNLPFYHLASGVSPRNNATRHMVIMKNGELAHDPHPDNTGIVNVESVYVLVPLDSYKPETTTC